jgi:hypothetical protein
MNYTPTTNWMRNYGAMADPKLRRCVTEFERGYGDAVNRVVQRGGSLEDNRTKCEYEARKRGMIETSYVGEDTNVKTEARFCPECETKKPFYLDDYICVNCRESMS